MAHRTEQYSTHEQTERARELRKDSTIPERILWGLLRGRRLAGLKFRRQAPVGPYVVDFLCEEHKLVVELDGLSHVGRAVHDERRTTYLASRGLVLVRVTNDQVLADTEMVAADILRPVCLLNLITPGDARPSPESKCSGHGDAQPSPQPSPRGRGGRKT